MFYSRAKGQSTLEYVILLGFVVAALIAMGVYMKRGAQGRLRESTDQIGEQYDARNTTSEYTTVTHLKQTENVKKTGESTVEIESPSDNVQTKTGWEKVGKWDNP
ncbi:MAG: hypothetical protein M0R17_13635 [Candidatus Omnitrophica bacterium]|jgi:uncharacterized protein (UPF0333 family)|nr:hypothetical protein [Candidatus Omnitrophota bacterium]MDD5253024.1 hypothetical protein [Candidatus Omnitrophota bacterium]